jgi:hypothetical protein
MENDPLLKGEKWRVSCLQPCKRTTANLSNSWMKRQRSFLL